MFQTTISDSQNRPICQPGKGADGLKPNEIGIFVGDDGC